MRTTRKTYVLLATLMLAGLSLSMQLRTAGAGELEPTAPPGPTMKTLAQVEPRIPVSVEEAARKPHDGPLQRDANNLIIITEPGSYYLTGDIVGEPDKNGIMIDASNVVLDLMGYSIVGVPGSGHGVVDGANIVVEAVDTICNGTIRNWGGNGICFGNRSHGPLQLEKLVLHSNGRNGVEVDAAYIKFDGIDSHHNGGHGLVITGGGSGRLEDVTVFDNDGNGVEVDAAFIKFDGIDSHHNGGHGLVVDANTFIAMDEVAFNNNGGCGITATAAHIRIQNADMHKNGGHGLAVSGNSICHLEDVSFTYNAGSGASFAALTNVDAYSGLCGYNGGGGIIINGYGYLNGFTSTNNGGVGIAAGPGSMVEHCVARHNSGDGIRLSSETRAIKDCSEHNGLPRPGEFADAAGIRVTGSGNRLEANHVGGNGIGIKVEAPGNLIIRNSATQNTVNYEVAPNNTVGPVLGAGDVGSDNPHANYQF